MSPARKHEQSQHDLEALFDELSKSCAPLAKYESSSGGKSFEDALQERFLAIVEQQPDALPAQEVDCKAYVLSMAAKRYVADRRRERDHEKLLDRAAPNMPAESLAERLLVNDENRRIIMLTWIALEGKTFERRLLYVLASGVDHKDNKLLARYLECSTTDVVNGKKRLFPVLRIVREGLCEVDNLGDEK